MLFKRPFTKDNLKKQYYDLCKKLHPDAGGDEQQFREMKDQYDSLLEMVEEITKQQTAAPEKGPYRKANPKVVFVRRRKATRKDFIISFDSMFDYLERNEELLNEVLNAITKRRRSKK